MYASNVNLYFTPLLSPGEKVVPNYASNVNLYFTPLLSLGEQVLPNYSALESHHSSVLAQNLKVPPLQSNNPHIATQRYKFGWFPSFSNENTVKSRRI